ncbi:MAG TPA: endonuclease III [Chloroflexi bacterium]|nr:endonuclease III [Chloroflexota bacterium]HHW87643.1 endonuclease III [Chloroflexota bacterium]
MSAELTAAAPAAERIGPILALLHAAYPDARCALDHRNALELLVATILSAQCTDERVNKVTPALFARYPDARAFAEADRAELEEMIHSTGFYRNKAKNIQEACARIVEVYDGQVPATMDDLLSLAGVARKTANVVLGTAYHMADGIVVDTHVKRLAQRLGLSTQNDPDKIERDLQAITPREEWIDLSHLLIFHGRRVCDARKPNCPGCVIRHLCPAAQA